MNNMQYQEAKKKIIFGKKLVIIGFAISVMGISVYCLASFVPDLNNYFNGRIYNSPGTLLIPTFLSIGIGTVLWLIGSFIHLKGVIEDDPNE